jgi:zinc protease
LRRPARNPSVLAAYRAPPAGHPDMAVLDVIQYALGVGSGSRLWRSLVFDQKVVSSLGVDWSWRVGPGLFMVYLDLPPNGDTRKAETALYAELERLATNGLTPLELRRAANNLRANALHELSTLGGRTDGLGQHEMLLGDWRAGLALVDTYRKTTSAQVKRTARAIFSATQRSVVELVPLTP